MCWASRPTLPALTRALLLAGNSLAAAVLSTHPEQEPWQPGRRIFSRGSDAGALKPCGPLFPSAVQTGAASRDVPRELPVCCRSRRSGCLAVGSRCRSQLSGTGATEKRLSELCFALQAARRGHPQDGLSKAFRCSSALLQLFQFSFQFLLGLGR